MSKILIATVPVIGHITPFLPLVRALVARGHEVAWYSGRKYRARIQASGARFFGYVEAPDSDDAAFDAIFPERAQHQGMAQLKFDMKHIFIDAAPGQLADLERVLATFPADLVLADPGMIGAVFLRERTEIPLGILGVLPPTLTSVDVAPFGLGLARAAAPWRGCATDRCTGSCRTSRCATSSGTGSARARGSASRRPAGGSIPCSAPASTFSPRCPASSIRAPICPTRFTSSA
jgi:hypothetical protein